MAVVYGSSYARQLHLLPCSSIGCPMLWLVPTESNVRWGSLWRKWQKVRLVLRSWICYCFLWHTSINFCTCFGISFGSRSDPEEEVDVGILGFLNSYTEDQVFDPEVQITRLCCLLEKQVFDPQFSITFLCWLFFLTSLSSLFAVFLQSLVGHLTCTSPNTCFWGHAT